MRGGWGRAVEYSFRRTYRRISSAHPRVFVYCVNVYRLGLAVVFLVPKPYISSPMALILRFFAPWSAHVHIYIFSCYLLDSVLLPGLGRFLAQRRSHLALKQASGAPNRRRLRQSLA